MWTLSGNVSTGWRTTPFSRPSKHRGRLGAEPVSPTLSQVPFAATVFSQGRDALAAEPGTYLKKRSDPTPLPSHSDGWL